MDMVLSTVAPKLPPQKKKAVALPALLDGPAEDAAVYGDGDDERDLIDEVVIVGNRLGPKYGLSFNYFHASLRNQNLVVTRRGSRRG